MLQKIGPKPAVLFVCLGNICRSPAADGMARQLSDQLALGWTVDSAGTGAWHVGSAPDDRMTRAAAARGIDLSSLRARQVLADDFYRFDHIFAMDRQNYADLDELRPRDATARLHLFLQSDSVPDPYYGGDDGFEHVLDLIENRLS